MEESIHQQSSSIHHQHTNIGPNTLQSAQMNRPTSIPTILKSRGSGGDGEDEGVLPGSSLFYAPQEESAQAQATGRKKLWQCIYPGCAEPPKTHYNCFSHVWNSHIRRSLSPEHPLSKMTYKNITDRTIVKKLCRQYIIELPDENKRRGKTSYNIDQQQATVPQLLQFEPAEIAEGTSYSLDHDGVTKIAISPEGLARLCVCGEVFAEHGFLQRSDIRFKEDIQPIGGALKKILQITGKTFRYKSEAEGPARMGFIAQELEAVVPDAVHRDEYGLSVDIICLVPLLLEALKEVYVQTQRAQSEKAKRLNEALRDALAKTQFLNEKLDFYRSSSDDDSDFGSISDSSECIKHTRVQLTLNDDLGNPSNTISNNSKAGSKFAEKSKNQKKSTQAKNIHSYGSDELFVGDDVTSPTSMYSQDEATPAKKRHFHYRFSFGPPIIVLVFCAAFFCAGITLLCFLNGFVFAWAYSFFVSAVLALSLLSQGKEIKSEINNYEIEMFWHEENSLNVYFLAVIGTFGLICTLILGTPSIVCIAIFVFAIVSTGILSIAFHRKYRIRMQSILVMSFGVLFFFSMCFIFIYMAQPYKSGFKGLNGSRIDIPVEVGKKITPITLKDLPWNCFSPKVELTGALPDGVELFRERNPPMIEGEVNSSFTSIQASIALICNSYQKLECGTLVFKQCAGYTNRNSCMSNSCSWCSLGESPTEGFCGFCNNNFTSSCVSKTGKYSSTC